MQPKYFVRECANGFLLIFMVYVSQKKKVKSVSWHAIFRLGQSVDIECANWNVDSDNELQWLFPVMCCASMQIPWLF